MHLQYFELLKSKNNASNKKKLDKVLDNNARDLLLNPD